MLDDVDYKNGSKNHWRRTMWNRLREQINDPRDAVILYLPGSKDLDRDEALRRGFKPWNMIAVERNKKVTKLLRDRGTITINCGLKDVLSCWPSHTKLSAVIADLQCGITEESLEIADCWWKRDCMSDVVYVFNLQRGRERESFSSWIGRYNLSDVWQKQCSQADLSYRHRVSILIDTIIKTYAKVALEIEQGTPLTMTEENVALALEVIRYSFDAMTLTRLPSYRSTEKSPYFDSMMISRKSLGGDCTSMRVDEHVKKCVSAALAIRTQRKKTGGS